MINEWWKDSDTWVFIGVALYFIGWAVRRIGVTLPSLPALKTWFYPAYGIALLLGFSVAHLTGLGLLDADTIRDVPKTVRQNPGVYRSHYVSHYRSYGGK